MEDFKKKYKEAIERATTLYDNSHGTILKKWLEQVFPELKESEDESIRKWLIGYFNQYIIDGMPQVFGNGLNVKDVIAWLEKQGEQEKPQVYETEDGEVITYSETDGYKVGEPKFKPGDWVVTSYGKVNQVIAVDEDGDGFTLDDDTYFSGSWKDSYHLYTLQDAKDGDVLVTVDDKRPFIYKGCLDPNHPDSPVAYCGIDAEGDFCCGGYNFNHWWTSEKVQPATKEQRDQLEKEMADAGYTFDFESKELKKIEQKPADWLQELEDKLSNATPKQLDEWKEKYFNEEPAEWNEDDEEKFRDVIRLIEQGAPVQPMRDHYTNWLKSLKEKVQPQPQTKPEWSEEDEKFFKTALWHISYSISNGDSADIHCDTTEWFKSLKDRVQPKLELTQLDKNVLEAAIAFVEQNKSFSYWCGIGKHTVLSALRSLGSRVTNK